MQTCYVAEKDKSITEVHGFEPSIDLFSGRSTLKLILLSAWEVSTDGLLVARSRLSRNEGKSKLWADARQCQNASSAGSRCSTSIGNAPFSASAKLPS